MSNTDLLLATIPVAVASAALAAVAIVRKLLHVCAPHEILIFSGRTHQLPDGREVGFRVVFGGRALRVPVLERVEHMDMRLLSVPMVVQGAYSAGGIPLSLHAVANVKISSDPKLVGNAIERFLGQPRVAIARVAKETLEGHLRGVVANMTPEEVNEDRLKFAERLRDEAEEDLHKLGLQLDTLKIQHVADDRGYLDSIGRKRIAEVLRTAEVAESDAVRTAEKGEAAATARGEVARAQAETNILKQHNAVRQHLAELEAAARAEESRAVAAGQEARAEAEKELQEVRAERERLRLIADVALPAEAERRVREFEAAGLAAPIAENGRAMAQALAAVAEAWRNTQGKAMDIYVMQNLETLVDKVTKAAACVDIKQVSVMDSGDGETLAGYVRAYPAIAAGLLKEISQTLGVDIPGILQGKPDRALPAKSS